MKQIPIYAVVDGKKILFGTVDIQEIHGDAVYHPMIITSVNILNINLTRELGMVDLQ